MNSNITRLSRAPANDELITQFEVRKLYMLKNEIESLNKKLLPLKKELSILEKSFLDKNLSNFPFEEGAFSYFIDTKERVSPAWKSEYLKIAGENGVNLVINSTPPKINHSIIIKKG